VLLLGLHFQALEFVARSVSLVLRAATVGLCVLGFTLRACLLGER